MTGDVPTPRAILFDWDNTLVDTWPVIHKAMSELFGHFGMPAWSLEETKTRVRQSMRDSFPALFGARWEEARDVFYDCFERVHLEALEAHPAADIMLSAFVDRGVHMAVVSNKQGKYLRLEVEKLGWNGHFANLVGAGDAPRDKPAPDPIPIALKGSGIVPAGHVWFVGDTGVDMQIAHATGLTPVLVRNDPDPPGEFDAYPPAIRLSDLSALHALVTRL